MRCRLFICLARLAHIGHPLHASPSYLYADFFTVQTPFILLVQPSFARRTRPRGSGCFRGREARVPYLVAVQEGWAPQPTNDVQKAIWDKVHALPTEPIKIKPEEKKTEK